MNDDVKLPGWHLNVRQRARIVQNRAMVQKPTEADSAIVAANARAMTATGSKSTIEGIPLDVLMTLESLRQLAEQGNRAAKWMYEEERRKLGIDLPAVMEV